MEASESTSIETLFCLSAKRQNKFTWEDCLGMAEKIEGSQGSKDSQVINISTTEGVGEIKRIPEKSPVMKACIKIIKEVFRRWCL